MEIEIFTACDNVQNYNGKLVIIGTFHQVNGINLPIVLSNMGVVFSASFTKGEVIPNRFALQFKTSDSDFINPITGTISQEQDNGPQTLNIFFNLRDVVFRHDETHYIDFLLDDVLVKRFPIKVLIN